METSITYGQLYDRLRELGFTQHDVEKDGQPRSVFEHKTNDRAMMILPTCDRNELVAPFFIRSVLTNLQTHELLPSVDPIAVLMNNSANGVAPARSADSMPK